ncbi:QRFP-like peptide receptor [Oculina patagonica]
MAFTQGRMAEMITFTILYAITMLVSLVGNTLLIYIVWTKPAARSLTSFMFVNMAVADLLVTLVVMPYAIAHFNTGGKWLLGGVIGEITCKVVLSSALVTITASILCLTFMAIDKFYAVVYPFRRHLWFRKPKLLTPLIWILSMALMSVAPVLVVQDLNYQTPYCTYQFSNLGHEMKARLGVYVYYFVINYMFPLSVMFILYAIIAHKLWFHNVPGNQLDQHRENREITKRKVVRMLIIVVTVFALCWLPGQVYHFLSIWVNDLPALVMNLCFWFGNANSAINPWLYIGLNSKISSAASRLINRKSKSRNLTS